MTASADDRFRGVRTQLADLRDSLPALQNDPKYSQLIDEFIREYEFTLALEALCDFLLEPEAPPPDGATLARIEALHRLMGVQDSCLEKLKHKAARS